jgi:hypothetical protein
VISADFSSVASCAITIRNSQPQALTMCSADFLLALSNERRITLPSIAITPCNFAAKPSMKRWNAARNWSGSSRRNSRLKVSWQGRPFSSLRKLRRKVSFERAKVAMSTAPCPPLSTVHRAIISSSWKSCRAAFPVRGSSKDSQHAAN